jgi:hypothetical protein
MKAKSGLLSTWLVASLCASACFACMSLGGSRAVANEPQDSCVVAALGLKDPTQFSAFVKSVRAAVASRNWSALGDLVRYPVLIRVVDDMGVERRRSIGSRQEFERIGPDLFAPSMLARIGSREVECEAGQVGFGGGVFWATSDRGQLAIIAVDSPGYRWSGMATQPLIECRTKSEILVVDRPKSSIRVRIWKADESSVDPSPLLESLAVMETVEGEGVCRRRAWRFASGAATYELAEPGCAVPEGPDGLVGLFSKHEGNTEMSESYCMAVSRR